MKARQPNALVGDRTEQPRHRRSGDLTLIYSAESEPLAEEILQYAERCHGILCQWFRPAAQVKQVVYWLSMRDWKGTPENYGFPSAVGPDAYLAAADVDHPTQLTLIADAMEIQRGGPEVSLLAELLGLEKIAPPDAVYRCLSQSKSFFVTYTCGFILPHELIHGFCNSLEYPLRPRWYYEGIAQWGAYQLQKNLRSGREAELIFSYYQLLWDRGSPHLAVSDFVRADELGDAGLDTPNYAWYHAGLLRMFRELDEMSGGEWLPKLIHAVESRYRGRSKVPHHKMVETFSDVIGCNLESWFRDCWRIGR